ncbi:hypothetical protein IJF86_01425 [Candidatus Saccharibacteria bacterium]|nr:hypothetical protein [Candidatus Saccharibacteria bacterium]
MRINLQTGEILEKFVEQMMQEKGEEASGPKKTELIDKLDKKIEEAFLMALPDERLLALNKALDEDASDKKINAILFGSGIDFRVVAATAMKKFKNEYLGEGR